LTKAGEKGAAIVFISTGNTGLAPAFFPPVSWIYTARTREARAIFMDVSRTLGVQYVDLFREKGNELFLNDPDRYYTPDYLHPSSEGYRVWYEELRKQTGIVEILGKARSIPGR
jgi:lysophospholipase L1-like esterase